MQVQYEVSEEERGGLGSGEEHIPPAPCDTKLSDLLEEHVERNLNALLV